LAYSPSDCSADEVNEGLNSIGHIDVIHLGLDSNDVERKVSRIQDASSNGRLKGGPFLSPVVVLWIEHETPERFTLRLMTRKVQLVEER
jgi:hypothetical protein